VNIPNHYTIFFMSACRSCSANTNSLPYCSILCEEIEKQENIVAQIERDEQRSIEKEKILSDRLQQNIEKINQLDLEIERVKKCLRELEKSPRKNNSYVNKKGHNGKIARMIVTRNIKTKK
jgi:uncharacterized protein YoxC